MSSWPIFLDEIRDLLTAPWKESYQRQWDALVAKKDPAIFTHITDHPQLKELLAVVFAYSPFISKTITQYPQFFADVCMHGAEHCFEELKFALAKHTQLSAKDLMKEMRVAKSKASMLTALADIAGIWPLEKVTAAMSEFAQICTRLTVAFLLKEADARRDIKLKYPEDPELESGVFVLAMGKLGAGELNYSSDIDLIVFFEREAIEYTGHSDVQHLLSKMAQEMVRLLQERTAEGYVFRVDLRLRPDPASTPAAMSVAGAMTYYETVGQNWERAAFIKARPIAGDIELGRKFLRQLVPFLWRKHLDFAAIADIQSIKRQMDERTGRRINLPGHNVKTGLGGIREIEFFAQIHQLIWGGRISALRTQATCQTLHELAENNLIEYDLAEKLIASYRFLRRVEHRLQMIDDQQTHSMPVSEDLRVQFAEFMGYSDKTVFEDELLSHLEFVHRTFAGAFRGQYSLSGDEGKLSFTGVENDPQTLETISKMGYRNPASVSEIIQGWHRGSRRATRTKRAREMITELTPALLKAFAATTDPDQTFIHFDEFLIRLPAGVQLFSLFNAKPDLLNLIATIMGYAPAMAVSLSKNPSLLDVVLTAGFYQEFMDKDALLAEISAFLAPARDFEDEMDIIRRFRNERQFQAGVQLITGRADTMHASRYLSDIADICIEAMLKAVERNFKIKQDDLHVNQLAVIALGRLGARELTFGSDIDMVFVYDGGTADMLLPPQHGVYNKLSQRFISAVTSLTREGRLYEIDTRLRPSGGDGALAVSEGAFAKYMRESAWTFELMAFTRIRVITGNKDLGDAIYNIVGESLMRSREQETLVKNIVSLRAKITKEFGNDNPWNLKYVHGGIIDLDFLAQYFILLHAGKYPDLIAGSSGAVFTKLIEYQLIDGAIGGQLVEAHGFFSALFALVRLCGGGVINETVATDGLKHIIAKTLHLKDFDEVKAKLVATIATVKGHFEKFIA